MGDKAPQETLFSVGTRYEEWNTKQDGYRVEWSESGLVLYAMLNGISEREKQQYEPQKELIVRYVIIEDICYFTFSFGDMPWSDCPFSPALYTTIGQKPSFVDIEEEQGLSLPILLIDTSTGELCKVRLVGLGHDFSVEWQEWAKKAAVTELKFAEYNKRIDKTYSEYSSVDLAKMGQKHEYRIKGEQ